MAIAKLDRDVDLHPISALRERADTLLAQVRATGRPVVLTEEGHHAAVLLGIDEYRALLEELDALLDVHDALQEAAEGHVVEHDEVKEALLGRYA